MKRVSTIECIAKLQKDACVRFCGTRFNVLVESINIRSFFSPMNTISNGGLYEI